MATDFRTASEREMDELEALAVRVLGPFGVRFSGEGPFSRYAYLEDVAGRWGVKVRISDHYNQSRLRNSADVNLVTGTGVTADQIWRRVLEAIHRNAS